jgi:hypothetical protein
MIVTNALAYYNTATVTSIKCFIVQDQRKNALAYLSGASVTKKKLHNMITVIGAIL